jgi:hypothetical protein
MMGSICMVRIHARIQQQNCVAIGQEMPAETIKAACLTGDARAVLI